MFRNGKRIHMWAPGKLNLHLELLARRTDGFHELETLMVPIRVFDTLIAQPDLSGDISLTSHWATGLAQRASVADADRFPLGDLPESEHNIAFRAVRRFREVAGVEDGLSMQLVKRIPSRAGLGGASTDAAAALLAANHAWQLGWPAHRLAELAAELGSDVPFFLSGSPAVCRGRGEIVEPIRSASQFSVVIVKPPVGLSTQEVYQHSQVPDHPRELDSILDAFRLGRLDRLAQRLFNRLQEAAMQLSPWIQKVASLFDRLSVPGHLMSGSGTSYFALCRHRRQAMRVAAALRAAGLGTVMAVSTTCSRVSEQLS